MNAFVASNLWVQEEEEEEEDIVEVRDTSTRD
jgi:hypothetical protein